MNFFWSYAKKIGLQPIKYGLLYNNWACYDSRNLTASGWHLPTYAEYAALNTYLGGQSIAGGKLKETGLTYWNTPNTGATNEVFFNGRGCGQRIANGGFSELNTLGYNRALYTGYNVQVVLYATTAANIPSFLGNTDNDKRLGWGQRAVKDSTTLSNGQSGTYTGNNGRIYRTICINGVEWLADNLAETKFRNGDTIPEVTDNAAWEALTTGALCAYNNDWSNV